MKDVNAKKYVWMAFFCGCIGAAAPGCHEMQPAPQTEPREGEEVKILHQISGVHSHETRPMQLVVRDTDTLAQIPLADVPVNFAEEMLLVVTLGRVTSDEYSVSIGRVWRENGKLRVAINVEAPETAGHLEMSSPYCVAVVPRCDLNVADFSVTVPARTRSWEQSTPPESWGGPEKQAKPPKLNREKKR